MTDPRPTPSNRPRKRKRLWKAGNLCTACGLRFRAVSSFDRHRVGRGDDRRCRTVAELRSLGWSFSARRGGWTHAPRQQALRLEGA